MFTITTWNILADRYSDVYNSVVEKDVLLWSNRIKGIIKKIKELNSDVVCLQEVELSNVHIDFIELFSEYVKILFILYRLISKSLLTNFVHY